LTYVKRGRGYNNVRDYNFKCYDDVLNMFGMNYKDKMYE
jgi:hypothetical protein